MKVSIQIPAYNQESFIAKAIDSALMQDYPDLEIIVLDDNSSDSTFNIAASYTDPRVRVYKNNYNLGRTGNYRKLLYELVSGNWVVNLDGDDFFTDPSFISKGIQRICSHPGILFYQACIRTQGTGKGYQFRHRLLGHKPEALMDGKEYFRRFNENEFFGHLSTIYHVQTARKVGFYEFNNLTSDAESLLKLALHGNVYLDNKVVGVWNIHSHNESRTALTKNEETLQYFDRIRSYAIPIIGEKAAQDWYLASRRVNLRSYMEELAKADFPAFIKKSVKTGYFTNHAILLTTKKLLNRL